MLSHEGKQVVECVSITDNVDKEAAIHLEGTQSGSMLLEKVLEIWIFVLTTLERDALEILAGTCSEYTPHLKACFLIVTNIDLIVYGEMLKIGKASEKEVHLIAVILCPFKLPDCDFEMSEIQEEW